MNGVKCVLVVVVLSIAVVPAFSQDASPTKKMPLGAAMVQLAQHGKAGRGSLQRSNTLLEFPTWTEVDDMQIAFVIDNTESMGANIENLKSAVSQFVSELEVGAKSAGAKTRFSLALVTYSDSGSGIEHELITDRQFVEVSVFQEKLKNLKTVTGEPHFNELVDVGMNAAARSLDWKDPGQSGKVARWMVVCGDAPPYPMVAGPSGVGRRFSDEQLLEAINTVGITVHGFVCDTGFSGKESAELKATFEKELPFFRDFLKKFTVATKGEFIDLSDQHTLELLNKMAQSNGYRFSRVTGLSQRDIDAFDGKHGNSEVKQDVGVAVLPLAGLEQVLNGSLTADSLEVMAATSIVNHLKQISGCVVSPGAILAMREDMLKEDVTSIADVVTFLSDRSVQSGIGFVITGTIKKADGKVNLTLSLHNGLELEPLQTVEKSADESRLEKLYSESVKDLYLRVKNVVKDDVHRTFFASLEKADNRVALAVPLSKDRDANEWLLKGIAKAEQATKFLAKDPKGIEMLTQAKNDLERALKTDTGNVMAHLMVASVVATMPELRDVQMGHLEEAFKAAASLDDSNPLKWEAVADYHLIKSKKYNEAIDGYKKVISVEGPELAASVKRAHWMLAGIYLGDWVEDSSIRDPEQAREHILAILTQWPESPEAAFYEMCRNQQRSGAEEIDIPSDGQEQSPQQITFASLAKL